MVRDQISALTPKRSTSTPQTFLPNIPNLPAMSTAPMVPPASQPISQPLQQLLNPGTLAELIKNTAARQQPTPPPQIPNIIPQMATNSISQPSITPVPENPLLAALRARGLLPSASAPPAASAGPSANLASAFPLIVPGQVQYTPPVSTPQPSNISNGQLEVQMNTASIKM